MALEFGKGIQVISGFDLAAAAPIDNRYVVATIADRDAHVTNNRAYEGMLCYVEATKIMYRYNGTSWDEFGVTTATTITASGDINEATVTTGTGATASLSVVLKDIITAGTGCKITVNAKGQVTAIADLAADDIPTLTLSKISDAGTAAAKNAATTGAGNVLLIGADGKIADSVLPSLALTEVTVVANEAAMLALQAQPGDVAVREDVERTYMLKSAPATTAANWVELKTPTDHVLSVNGKTGTVVLSTTDVAEGTNLYYTEARATANFTTNFALASSTSLADTANIVYVGDAIAATCITEDTTHRFVTDAEKTLWNAAAHILVGSDAAGAKATMNVGDFYYEIPAQA